MAPEASRLESVADIHFVENPVFVSNFEKKISFKEESSSIDLDRKRSGGASWSFHEQSGCESAQGNSTSELCTVSSKRNKIRNMFTRPGKFCRMGCVSPDIEVGRESEMYRTSTSQISRNLDHREPSQFRKDRKSHRRSSMCGSWLRHQFSSPVLVTRLVMMVLLVVITVVLSVGLWYATGVAYNSAINKINNRLRDALILRTRDYFQSYVENSRQVTTTFARVLEHMLVYTNAATFSSLAITQLVSPLMWTFFTEGDNELSSLAYVQINRQAYVYQHLQSLNVSNFLYTNTTMANGTAEWYRQPVNQSTGVPVNDPVAVPPITLLSSAQFFHLFLTNASFTKWNLFPTSLGPVLLCAQAVKQPAGSGAGVAGLSAVASGVQKLNNYLREVDFEGATIFVQEKSGPLIASSANVTNYDNSTGTVQLVNATEVANPTIAAAAEYLRDGYSQEFLLKEPLAASDITIAGTKCYINTVPLVIDNLEMIVVIVITRSSIMGGIDKQRSRVLLIMCIAGAGVLFIGWAVIVFVTLYVSIRMRPKEELLKQQEETQRAQAASEVKSQFLANISHDLRTPMAGILGLLDIMLCDRLTAEQEANLRQMKSCAASLLGLLNNLLDLAKVEAGKMQLEVLEFDIVGELESLVDMFSVQGLSNGTEIALDLSDDIERTVKGDPSRVRQVFANLLSNACKFTKEGHVLVRGWMQHCPPPHLAHRSSRPENDSYQGEGKKKITFIFEVDDTGPGIPPHKRDMVFEKFQQADLSTTRTHGGTGLGLGIVRSLVKLMGGSIAVVDKEGPGACFQFDLTFECLDQTSNWKNSLVQPEFLLPKLSSVEGGQVLLAMKEESVGAGIASGWMERRGLHVWRVSDFDDISVTVSNMLMKRRFASGGMSSSRSMVAFSAPLDRAYNSIQASATSSASGADGIQSHEEPNPKTDSWIVEESSDPSRLILAIIDASLIPNPFQFLAEELHIFRARLQSQGVVIAWLVEHNTTAETRRALRRSGCAVASKPLYASRMAPLLALATARKGITHNPNTTMSMGTLPPSATGATMAKQQQQQQQQEQQQQQTSFMEQEPPGVTPPPAAPWDVDASGNSDPERGGGKDSRWESVSFQLLSPVDSLLNKPAAVAAGQSSFESFSSFPQPPPENSPISSQTHLGNPEKVSETVKKVSLSVSVPSESERSSSSAEHGSTVPVVGATDQVVPSVVPDKSLRLAGRTRSLTSPRRQNSGGNGNFDGALKGLHVLIAEDTPLLKKVAIIRMQKLGCTVQAVSDGKEAVDAVLATYQSEKMGAGDGQLKEGDEQTKRHFDVVLMDCQMPVMDGYGATAAIREAEKGTKFHTPIVALTAHAMTSDERKCLDAGMDAYLTKPIDPVLMASTILKLVRKDAGNGGMDGENGGELPDATPLPLNATTFSKPSRGLPLSRTSSEVVSASHARSGSMNLVRERYLDKA